MPTVIYSNRHIYACCVNIYLYSYTDTRIYFHKYLNFLCNIHKKSLHDGITQVLVFSINQICSMKIKKQPKFKNGIMLTNLLMYGKLNKTFLKNQYCKVSVTWKRRLFSEVNVSKALLANHQILQKYIPDFIYLLKNIYCYP